MSYHVYNHKQEARGILESPQPELGFTQSPQTNNTINLRRSAGALVAASRIYGAGKQLFNTYIDTQGDIRIQQTLDGLGQAVTIGTEVATLGPVGAAAVEVLRYLINVGTNAVQNKQEQVNQSYIIQKRGVAIDKFVGTGERID